MIFSEIGPNTLNKELNRYLGGSRLSLSQVAKSLGVSKGHLSEIKNGKAQPALNTGLRILKICGLELDQRKAWAHFYNTSISEEYLEVHDDWEKENSRKLNEKVSFLLARDLDLMNAYVDIVGEEERGIALVDLRIEYGRSIESKLQKLVDQNVVEIEITDLGKNFRSGKVDPIMTKNSSYDLVKTVVDDQQLRYQAGDNQGTFKFHINDVDTEGYNKLTDLLETTMKQAEKIMFEHKKKRRSGGDRYAFEILLGKLKSFVIFTLIGLAAFSGNLQESLAQSGGLSGGSSREALKEYIQQLAWRELESREDISINWPEVYMLGEYVKVNNLCILPEERIIRTIEDVKVCLKTTLTKEFCWLEAGTGLENCTEYNLDTQAFLDSLTLPYSQVVTHRRCLLEEYRPQEINLNYSGVFARFNDPNTGSRNNRTHFQDIENQSLSFDVQVFQNQAEETRSYNKMITEKNYQLPTCL